MMHEINSSLVRRRHCGVAALNCRSVPGVPGFLINFLVDFGIRDQKNHSEQKRDSQLLTVSY